MMERYGQNVGLTLVNPKGKYNLYTLQHSHCTVDIIWLNRFKNTSEQIKRIENDIQEV